jgi:cellulose synthase/poly-beta-1,6-N-acetylglucosamine synthase-like glycosyltransferase
LIAIMLMEVLLAFLLVIALTVSIMLLKGKELKIEPAKVIDWPFVSIIVPTFNESSKITKKLEELSGLDYPKERLEIIVVDESSDDTPDRVDEMRRLKGEFISLIRVEGRRGLAHALDAGYRAARGSILIKCDCDAEILDRSAIKVAVGYLGRNEVGAVTGNYVPRELGETFYRKMLHGLQVAESNLDSAIIGHGAFLAFKRTLYRGLREESLADDTEIMIDIRSQGYKCLLVPAISVVEDHPTRLSLDFRQRSRRARGILRLFTKYRGLFLRSRYGLTGFLILPVELTLMVLLPLLEISTVVVLFVLTAIYFGAIVSLLAATALAMLVGLFLKRGENVVSTAIIVQFAGVTGCAMLLLPQSGKYEKVR